MNPSLLFVRAFFFLLSILFMIAYMVGTSPTLTPFVFLIGTGIGILLGCILLGVDFLFKRTNLRTLNTLTLGLFFGYLLGLALLLIFQAIIQITSIHLSVTLLEIIKIFIFLLGTFLGVTMTLRASDELYVSLPFVRLSAVKTKVKDILLDPSTLSDGRIIDLAASGLLDSRLVLPQFILKEMYAQTESPDETLSKRAQRALEVLHRLETMPSLLLKYNDTDFSEVKDTPGKILRLARLLDADILTVDLQRTHLPPIEGVHIINLQALSHALKPLMQRGEFLKVKIQRYGKEEHQGIGYLEDGAMVVINGGGDFLGETVRARVLSVKHTQSGRMIFCNAIQEGEEDDDLYEEE